MSKRRVYLIAGKVLNVEHHNKTGEELVTIDGYIARSLSHEDVQHYATSYRSPLQRLRKKLTPSRKKEGVSWLPQKKRKR